MGHSAGQGSTQNFYEKFLPKNDFQSRIIYNSSKRNVNEWETNIGIRDYTAYDFIDPKKDGIHNQSWEIDFESVDFQSISGATDQLKFDGYVDAYNRHISIINCYTKDKSGKTKKYNERNKKKTALIKKKKETSPDLSLHPIYSKKDGVHNHILESWETDLSSVDFQVFDSFLGISDQSTWHQTVIDAYKPGKTKKKKKKKKHPKQKKKKKKKKKKK